MLGSAQSDYKKTFDFLMVGGLSVFAYWVVVLGGFTLASFDVVWIMAMLAFLANWPHFAVSYQMLYGAHREKISTDPRFFFAAVVVPIVLACIMVCGAFLHSLTTYVALLFSMFFLVGWHYVKQAYGCFVVYGRSQGLKLAVAEQKIIKSCLYTLWAASFAKMFFSGEHKEWWGVKYSVVQLPFVFEYLINGVAFIGLFVLVALFVRRRLVEGKLPGIVVFTPLATAYLWLFPPLANSVYFYMIPFFHSVQYLLFSGTFTKNWVAAKEKSVGGGLLKWWGGAFILGALAFSLLPGKLDAMNLHDGEITPVLFFVAFNLFINIHHYFIDSVMWRSDNPEVRKYASFSSSGTAPDRVDTRPLSGAFAK